MNLNMNYLTSISIGLFTGSLILFIGRLVNLPITGVILSIIFAALVASFLYNPSSKGRPKHRALGGATASFLLCLIFSIFLTIYYIPNFNSILRTADISITIAIGIILLFLFIGGMVIGSIGGSIGSTIRDILSVVSHEIKGKKS